MDSSSSLLSENIKIPNFYLHFISIMFDLIEFQNVSRNLILSGFDPYSPLYYLIHDYLIKLVSLIFFELLTVCFQ